MTDELTKYCKHIHEKEELQKLNKEVAEWLDVTPYITHTGYKRHDSPYYITNPAGLLRELMKREDWYEFAKYLRLCGLCHILEPSVTWHSPTIYIHPSLVTEAGLLLLKVGEWMEEKNHDH